MIHGLRRSLLLVSAIAAVSGLFPGTAAAVLDVEDRGPVLQAGQFAMRITNIGAVGNPFFDVGRSFDPSFEFPRGSGQSLLKHADLWVGGTRSDGLSRVSGGPLLEWRPSLDADDRVRVAYSGRLGGTRFVDDDGDGRVDEESLNDRDDDGDGERDEDLGLPGAQLAVCTYRDDRRESIEYGYPNGEQHAPLGLEVKQEAHAWSLPGYDRIAGLHFEITNRSSEVLTDVWLGFVADLDAQGANDPAGFVDDVLDSATWSQSFNDGVSRVPSVIDNGAPFQRTCLSTVSGRSLAVRDARPGSTVPRVALVPLAHSLDPLAQLDLSPPDVKRFAFAPGALSFRTSVFARDLPPGQGGLPVLDADRLEAMRGEFPTAPDPAEPHDYALLVSCGPFPRVPPGRTISFDVAIVAGESADSLASAAGAAVRVHHGTWLNLLPDTTASLSGEWSAGKSGFTGHESCVEAPEGVTFQADPHCFGKWPDFAAGPSPASEIYEPGRCIWTDADCNVCTGFDGRETQVRWSDPGTAPPAPAYRVRPGDHRVTIEWNNLPEVLLAGGVGGAPGATFAGYYVYRLSDWRRSTLLPSPRRFETIGFFAADSLDGGRTLASVADTTLPVEKLLYGRRVYPVGRYRVEDTSAINGFDYLYVVTTLSTRPIGVGGGVRAIERIESPLVTSIDSLVTPSAAAQTRSGGVRVVPNPFRAAAPWDRPPVPGDVFTRHLDFVGLPRARSTIRIYTLAGDFVVQLDHDGTGGDGSAEWNLISRNGQDVESGIYLFTVDSPLGRQVGRFVVIR